jgi:pimeloyl-ACP methyl ester carboxylesterase
MPHITARDGTRLYCEEAGSGSPVIFVHEYAGDYRTWEMQMRFFSRAHRCITYSQRGYPPSDVPKDGARYSQDIARDDVLAVMDALKVDKAHVVGHSMGAYTALHVGIRAPARCISVVAAGCGWGSSPDAKKREEMKALAAETGKMFAAEGIAAAFAKYAERAYAPGTEEQGSARLRRIRPHVVGAFRGRACPYHVQSPAQAADAMGDGDGLEEIFNSAARHCRR